MFDFLPHSLSVNIEIIPHKGREAEGKKKKKKNSEVFCLHIFRNVISNAAE